MSEFAGVTQPDDIFLFQFFSMMRMGIDCDAKLVVGWLIDSEQLFKWLERTQGWLPKDYDLPDLECSRAGADQNLALLRL